MGNAFRLIQELSGLVNDVDISGIADDDMLVYNSSSGKWENLSSSGTGVIGYWTRNAGVLIPTTSTDAIRVPDITDQEEGLLAINVDERLLVRDDGTTTVVDWQESQLLDNANGNVSMDWDARVLKDADSQTTVDYGTNLQLNDNVGTTRVDWNNGYLNDNSGYQAADWGSRALKDGDGSTTVVDWDSQILADSSGNSAADWDARIAYDSSSQYSVDWSSRTLNDSSSNTVVDYGNQALYYNGTNVLDWASQYMFDSSGNDSVQWGNRSLHDSSGYTTADWGNSQLKYSGSTTTLDWAGQYLYDDSGYSSIQWSNRLLTNSSGYTTVDWSSQYLMDSSGSYTMVDWSSQYLNDSSGYLAIDWTNRQLIANDGSSAMLDWSTDGTFDAYDNDITTTGIGTDGYHIINQTADTQGLEINGYDDRSSKYAKLSLDSNGTAQFAANTTMAFSISGAAHFYGSSHTFGRYGSTDNAPNRFYGKVNGTKRYFELIVDETDDYAHFNREHTDMLGLKIDMPVDLIDNNLTTTGDVSCDTLATTGGRIVNTDRFTSGPQTLDATHHNVFCDTDGGAFTINLPAGIDGTEYRIINTGSGGNDVTITPNGSEDIYGSNSSITLSDGSSTVLVYETTEGWW